MEKETVENDINSGIKDSDGEGVAHRPRTRRRLVKFRTSEEWVKFYARAKPRKRKKRPVFY